jgi:hypothetical protein
VGYDFLRDEKVVSGEQYLGHDVTLVSEVFDVVFGAQIIETNGFGLGLIEFAFAVFVDYFVTLLDKFKTDVRKTIDKSQNNRICWYRMLFFNIIQPYI